MTPQRRRVPAEFVGAARLFHQRVTAGALQARKVLCSLRGPLERRYERRPTPRKDLLQDTHRRWLKLSALFGSLASSAKDVDGVLTFSHARLLPTTLSLPSWVGCEHGIGVVAVSLRIGKNVLETEQVELALVGMHAVGRWLERAGGSFDDLVDDLKPLFLAARTTLDNAEQSGVAAFNIPTSSGTWLGEIIRSNGTLLLSVRTFGSVEFAEYAANKTILPRLMAQAETPPQC